MAKRRVKSDEVKAAPQMLLCTLGTFFVFTKKSVVVEVLSDTETTRLWEKLTLAEGCVFIGVDHARQQVIRQVFVHDAEDFIPATSRECLMYYSEHYQGRNELLIKQLSACIIMGVPFGPDEANPGIDGGGEKVPAQPRPAPNRGPSGATFDVNDPNLYLDAAKHTLSEIAGHEVNITFA